MPWNDNAGGPGQRGQGDRNSGDRNSGDRGSGPWGGGPRNPWGQPPRQPQGGGGQGPDLEDMLRRWRERFRGGMGGGFGGGRGPGRSGEPTRRNINPSTIAGVAAAIWLLTGVYIVDEGERGVVSRFGAYEYTALPGLHWHLPVPLESVRVISIQSQRTIDIGVIEGPAGDSESLMITGDRNIVDIDFRVIYRLSDARAYLYNVVNPPEAVRGLAESAMREVVGQRELQEIITVQRAAVEQTVEAELQRALNSYESGVEVLQVQLLKAAPPADVVDAFNEVVRAGQVAETAINVATQYANEVVPRARGEAAQITQAAEAYREQTVRDANGESARFALVEAQYRAAPAVTRQRLYLEAMERIYRDADTVIIDRNAGAIPFLPLDQMRRGARGTGQAPLPPPATSAPPAQPQAGAAR